MQQQQFKRVHTTRATQIPELDYNDNFHLYNASTDQHDAINYHWHQQPSQEERWQPVTPPPVAKKKRKHDTQPMRIVLSNPAKKAKLPTVQTVVIFIALAPYVVFGFIVSWALLLQAYDKIIK